MFKSVIWHCTDFALAYLSIALCFFVNVNRIIVSLVRWTALKQILCSNLFIVTYCIFLKTIFVFVHSQTTERLLVKVCHWLNTFSYAFQVFILYMSKFEIKNLVWKFLHLILLLPTNHVLGFLIISLRLKTLTQGCKTYILRLRCICFVMKTNHAWLFICMSN